MTRIGGTNPPKKRRSQAKRCSHCSATFTRTSSLNRHVDKTHSAIFKPHVCEVCNGRFARSDILLRHKRTIHTKTYGKSCASCRTLKIKCDHQDSCEECAQEGKECTSDCPSNATAHFAINDGGIGSSSQEAGYDYTCVPPPVYASHFDRLTPNKAEFADYLPSPVADFLHTGDMSPAASNALLSPMVTYQANAGEMMRSPSTMADFMISSDLNPMPSSSFMDSFDNFDPASLGPVGGGDPVMLTQGNMGIFSAIDDFMPIFGHTFSSPVYPYMNNEDQYGQTAGPSNAGFQQLSPALNNDTQTLLAYLDSPLPDTYSGNVLFSPQSVTPGLNIVLGTATSNQLAIQPPSEAELQHYLYLFSSAFLSQMPIVHPATFEQDGKPQVLLTAMQACGALFVKTRRASAFIVNTLAAAREALLQEFAIHPTDTNDQVHLILAVVILQTIGLFHQKPDQRMSSSNFHTMLVSMIRNGGWITKNAAWEPAVGGLEEMWQDWAHHEMTKRALLLSYLHDCSHCIYFALKPSYEPAELELALPCEERLWAARTAADWLAVLQEPSPYGVPRARLVGASMPAALVLLAAPPAPAPAPPLAANPYALFVLAHALLRTLFTAGVSARLPPDAGAAPRRARAAAADEHALAAALERALANWHRSWDARVPDGLPGPPADGGAAGAPFLHDALPFYWLARVALAAYRAGLAPFVRGARANLRGGARFRLVKGWLKHIRALLEDGAAAERMEAAIGEQLREWQAEAESITVEDQEGLLGFFSE